MFKHFKGFTGNRFGGIAEIVREFLNHKVSILIFFKSVVDENSNNCTLCVYIQNSWFHSCGRVYEI